MAKNEKHKTKKAKAVKQKMRSYRLKFKVFYFLVFAFCLSAALYFLVSAEKKVQIDSGHRLIMGTFARIIAVAADSRTAKKCIEAGFEQIESVDDSMSDYKADSELSRVNRQAHERAVKVSEPLFEVLQKSAAFSRQSGGAFDITVGPLVDLYRSAEKKGAAPSKNEIAEAKSKVGFEKLKLDEQNRTVKFAVDGMRLDLGGIAKGYAIDKAVEAMQRCGAVGGMVDIGGDIRCFGVPKDEDKWLIGLQDPSGTEAGISTGKLLLTLELADAAVATSGDYRRFVLIDGKKYSHIIDRETGTGVEGLSSVTIICKNATEADALATAVSVMRQEKGLKLAESLAGTEAILISPAPKYEFIQTSGAQQYIRANVGGSPSQIISENLAGGNMYKKYQVARAVKPVELDGNWVGGPWADAEVLDVDQRMGDEPEHKPKTQVKLLYDDKFIYVFFRVEDKYIRAIAQGYQSQVWEDSCVEFFFTPGQDISLGYFNIEINCGGTMVFTHRFGRDINVTPVSQADGGMVEIFHSEPEIVEPEKKGQTTWVIQYRVPIDVLEKYCSVTRPAPKVTWRANFYKCANNTSHPHWLTWSAIGSSKFDFHQPEFFGTLEFK